MHWKHKNLILILLGIAIAFLISRSQVFQHLILGLGNFGYLGAFLAGMFFSSTFTVTIGGLILLNLGKVLPPFPLVLFSALGAVTCDLLIYKLIKDRIAAEIVPIYEGLEKLEKKSHLKKIFHTKYFGWTLPVVGALVMVTPLPDELAISLLGISNIKTLRFLLISLCSHGLGMFLVVSATALV